MPANCLNGGVCQGGVVVIVVDYGMGNHGAIVNMLEYLGFSAEVSSDPQVISQAERLILPGVGAFDRAMRSLRELDLVQPLEDAVLGRGVPVLGVCLGMQLLGNLSEEGEGLPGLGWIDARTIRLAPPPDSGLKVPHIGWSEVKPRLTSPLLGKLACNSRFYFVHGYHVLCDHDEDVAATCNYGREFCCAVSKGNIHGVQFHPEKSHRYGMELFRRFVEIS